MARSREWFIRHRGQLAIVLIALLFVIGSFEAFLLYEQRGSERAAKTQSARLLSTFLQGDTARAPVARGVSIRLQNVRFKWSDKVYIDTGNMATRAVPVEGSTVDFDDLGSFILELQQSEVQLSPDVLEGMLNESVFNYPGSKLRSLKVSLIHEAGRYSVRLTGRVNIALWIPFTMLTHLDVDTATNTLVMNVDKLKVFGFVPATRFVRWTPFHLERLLSVPPNGSLIIDGNRIMVKPFGLFPPPRINGRMSGVSVGEGGIRLGFAGASIHAPESTAKNYVYLQGGTSQFGRFRMVDTNVLIVDQHEADPFVFSLLHYADLIPRSQIRVPDMNSVRVTMPDF